MIEFFKDYQEIIEIKELADSFIILLVNKL